MKTIKFIIQGCKKDASFFFSELLAFMIQTIILCIVAIFSTCFFSDESGVISFTNYLVSEKTGSFIAFYTIAFFIVFCVLKTIEKVINNECLIYCINNALYEIPGFFYTIGAVITVAILTIISYAYLNNLSVPNIDYFYNKLVCIPIISFLLGCILRYFIKNGHKDKRTTKNLK